MQRISSALATERSTAHQRTRTARRRLHIARRFLARAVVDVFRSGRTIRETHDRERADSWRDIGQKETDQQVAVDPQAPAENEVPSPSLRFIVGATWAL